MSQKTQKKPNHPKGDMRDYGKTDQLTNRSKFFVRARSYSIGKTETKRRNGSSITQELESQERKTASPLGAFGPRLTTATMSGLRDLEGPYFLSVDGRHSTQPIIGFVLENELERPEAVIGLTASDLISEKEAPSGMVEDDS
jgi:hypothetical protein